MIKKQRLHIHVPQKLLSLPVKGNAIVKSGRSRGQRGPFLNITQSQHPKLRSIVIASISLSRKNKHKKGVMISRFHRERCLNNQDASSGYVGESKEDSKNDMVLLEQDENQSLSTTPTEAASESLVSSIQRRNWRSGGGSAGGSSRGGGTTAITSTARRIGAESSTSFASYRPDLRIHSRPYQSSPTRRKRERQRIDSNIQRSNELRIDSVQFHGRETELETWQNHILSNNGRQFVLLSGPSGSGKSRLVHQFTSRTTTNAAVTTVGTGDNKSRTADEENDDGDEEAGSSTPSSSSSPSIWAVGGKLDPRHNVPYSIFSLLFEDLYYAMMLNQTTEQEAVSSTKKNNKKKRHRRRADSDATAASAAQDDDSSIRTYVYNEICSRCREALNDEEVKLLIKFIPSLQAMLQVDSLNLQSDLEEQEAMRFKMGDTKYFSRTWFQFQCAFQKVIRIISECLARTNNRLVLVLDDLQWCDKASIDLLKMILTDTSTGASPESAAGLSTTNNSRRKKRKVGDMIVVGCIRSEDFNEDHPLAALVRELEEDIQGYDVEVHRLEIDNLIPKDIESVILDMMTSLDEDEETRCMAAKRLVNIVHQESKGNPLFAIHYVKEMFDSYGSSCTNGSWDLNGFLDRMDSDEDMSISSLAAGKDFVDVLLKKFQKLPKTVIRVLPLIGSLGSSFPRQMFNHVVNHFINIIYGISNGGGAESSHGIEMACLEAGLIEENGPEWYRWVNDAIQEATFCLVDDKDDLSSMQFNLANFLFENLDFYEREQSLFLIASLFQMGNITEHASGLNDRRRIELSRLYLEVGMKAINSSSFDAAASFLNAGLTLVPEKKRWNTCYNESVDLNSALAQAEFCMGNFDSMKKHCDEVIRQRDCPLLEKQRVYNALLDSVAAREGTEKASLLCTDLLSKLGCKSPKMGHGLNTKLGLMQCKASLKKRNDVSQYIMMRDPSKIWAMNLLDKLLTYYYIGRSSKLPFPILKSLRWTRKYGVSESSLPAFASVGFLLSAQVGDVDAGVAYANRALELLGKVMSEVSETLDMAGSELALARTYLVVYGFVLHWTTPYGTCRDQLLKGFEIGLKCGDTESAFWCCLSSLCFSLFLGDPLERLEVQLESLILQMRRQNFVKYRTWALFCLQSLLKLTGTEGNPTRHRVAREAINDDMDQIPALHAFQLYSSFFCGDHCAVVEHIEKSGDKYFQKYVAGAGLAEANIFLGALSCLSVARETGNRKYEKLAKGLSEKVKAWTDAGVKKGNPNVVHYRALLDAEWAAYRNNQDEAIHTFNIAIWMTERRGLSQDLALTHERCSDYYSSIGSFEKAQEHTNRAITLYKEWGAFEVVRRLKAKHPEFDLSLSLSSSHRSGSS